MSVNMVSDAQGNIKYLPGGSVKSVTCAYSGTRKEIPLASTEIKDGGVQTVSFGNLQVIVHDATTANVEIDIRADMLPALRAFVGAPPVAAGAASSAGSARIAVIAFQLAVAQTNEGQRDFADLQKKYAPKEEALKALSDEIDGLNKQLQDPSATMSDVERANKSKAVDDKKKQLDRETEDLRNDGQQDMQDLYTSLASKVYDVMQTYAEGQGFTLVLDISQQQSPVLYASGGTNITKEVIDAYNVKSGVPPPPAQPAADAPRPKAATPPTHAPSSAPSSSH